MCDVNLTISGEVAALRLEPGDIVVVKVDARLTQEHANRVRHAVQPVFPEGTEILVVDNLASLEVVRPTR